jgi:hypothetical protein
VTWPLAENRFNATHVAINTDMHVLAGIRLHPSGWGDDKRVTVAFDNFCLYQGDDVSPPETIDDLKASAENGLVTLAWTRPEDNLFAVKYDVYRSASPDALAIGANLIATVHTVHFTDRTIANPGEYHYRVVASDFAGNRSQPSNVASVDLDTDGQTVRAE